MESKISNLSPTNALAKIFVNIIISMMQTTSFTYLFVFFRPRRKYIINPMPSIMSNITEVEEGSVRSSLAKVTPM